MNTSPAAGAEKLSALCCALILLLTSSGAAADFTPVNPGFSPVSVGKVNWVDYDNDGDLDAFVCGIQDNFTTGITSLYRNDGNGMFNTVYTPILGLKYGAADWGDYDRDGDLDLLISGQYNGTGNAGTLIYRNDGYGFTYISTLSGVYFGSVGWGDCDNDGDLDALLGGRYNIYTFRNDSNNFVNANWAFPSQGWYMYTAWGDYDNDGDLDWATSASSSGGTRIFKQESPGTFSIKELSASTAFQCASWEDYDNDGDLDLLAMDTGATRLYRNDGADNFTEVPIGLPGGGYSSLAWGDYDNDGRPDILIAGNSITRIYRNAGGDTFTNSWTAPQELSEASVAFGDYDNDGDLDILLIGSTNGVKSTLVYRNEAPVHNTPPTPPANLTFEKHGNAVRLLWSAAADAQQPGGLSYNVRVSSTPGGANIVASAANLSTGWRRIPALGNCGVRLACDITNLSVGTYYWSVQAIDHAFAGSPFAAEASFTISTPNITLQPQATTVFAGETASLSVSAESTAPLRYQWFFNDGPLPGATNSTLSIANAHYTDQGNYYVRVSDVVGDTDSQHVFLTVNSAPVITRQPQGQTLPSGGNALYSMEVIGNQPFSYQWFYNGMELAGQTNATLLLTNLHNDLAGFYKVRVTNWVGVTMSDEAALNLYPIGLGLRSAPAGGPFDMVYDQARDVIYMSSGGSVLRYHLGSNAFMTPFAVGNSLGGLDLSPDGNQLAVAERASTYPTNRWIYLIDLRTGTNREVGFTPAFWESGFEWIVYGRDGTLLMTSDFTGGSAPMPLRWYNPATEETRILGSVAERAQPTVSADGSVIAIGQGTVSSGVLSKYEVASAQITDSAQNDQFSWIHPGVNHDGTQFTYSMDHATYVRNAVMDPIYTFGGTYLGPRPVGVVYHPTQDILYMAWGGSSQVRAMEMTNFTEVARYEFGTFFSTAERVAYRTRISRDGTLLMVATGSGVNFLRLNAAPPVISQNPANAVTVVGGSATFAVAAIGTPPFGYQWRYNGINIDGQTASSLSLTNLQLTNAGAYSAVVYNAGGSVTSSVAMLTVDGAPLITQHPTNATVLAGDAISLTYNAAGTIPFTQQWTLYGTNVPGATGPVLTVPDAQAINAGDYRVIVQNSYGYATSEVATVAVIDRLPLVTSHPGSLTGDAGSPISFSITAIGTEPISYQWQFEGNDLLNETNNSLTIPNLQATNAGDYILVLSNSLGNLASAPVSLTVRATVPAFSQMPQSKTVPVGAEVVFKAAAYGTEPIGYQWLHGALNLPGQNSASLRLVNVQSNDAGIYMARATNSVGSALSTSATLSFSPPPGFLWARSVGGSGNEDAAAVAVDTNGNVLVTGTFFNTVPMGTSNITSHGAADIYVAKYNSIGDLLWIRTGGSESGDAPHAIASDPSGNVYITGFLSTNALFDGIELTNVLGDIFIAKYDPNGTLLWVKTPEGISNDSGLGLDADASGNVFVTGYFNATARFGTNEISASGGSDSFVAKYDTDGNVLWVRRMGGNGNDQGQAVTVDPSGQVYVAGWFQGIGIFGDSQINTGGYKQIYIVAYDPAGNFLWVTTAGGAGNDVANGITSDDSGNIYLTGDFSGTATFGNITLTAAGNLGGTDIFVARMDNTGQFRWANRAGGTGSDYGRCIAADAGGSVYVTGDFVSTASFGNTNISANGWNSFVAMYDTTGGFQWVRQAGGPETEVTAGIAVGIVGNVFIAGSFFSQPATFGHISLPSAGGWDGFLAKMAAFDLTSKPILKMQTGDRQAIAGEKLILDAGAVGPGPISYQWRLNGSNIDGATSGSLIFPGVTLANGGAYSVVVQNPNGAVTSAVINVSVSVEPDFIWASSAGGTGNDGITAVASDASGNLYVAGYFTGMATIGGTSLSSHGDQDLFVAKFDLNRNLVWVQQAGGPGKDRATGIAVDPSGSVYVSGQFSGTASFSGVLRTSTGGTDLFIARYNPLGSLLWVTTGGGTGDDTANALVYSTNFAGSAFVAGTYFSSANIGSSSLAGGTSNNVFVARIAPSGGVAWARTSNGPGNEYGRAIAVDVSGNVFVAGGFSGNATFPGGNIVSVKDLDVFLAKYDLNGIFQWARRAGTAGSTVITNVYDDEALALAVDADGSIFMAGYFNNLASFGSNTASALALNKSDAFVAKYDTSGEALWVRILGGQGNDTATALASDLTGNAYVAGTFSGLGLSTPVAVRSAGERDVFVAMYDAAGRLQKVRRAAGSQDDIPNSLTPTLDGGVIAGGIFTGPASFGEFPLLNPAGTEGFLTKLQMFEPITLPLITSQPEGFTGNFGSNALLTVGAQSTTPVAYQWFRDGTLLPGQTGSSLRLTNLQYSILGDYSVSISNSFGSVTSLAALVTVELTPEVFWARKIGGTVEDQALAVAVDAFTNTYVAGQFSGTLSLGSSNVVSTGANDIFLAKFDPEGTMLWFRKAGGVGNDAAQGLHIDESGDVLVTGYFSGMFGWNNVYSYGAQDFFLARYTTDGSIIWLKHAGTGSAQGTSVKTDAEGQVYVTGSYYNTIDFDNHPLSNVKATNCFIVKLSPLGAVQWAYTTLGTNDAVGPAQLTASCIGTGLALDNQTNIYLTGSYVGSVNFGGGWIKGTNLYSNATPFVARFSPQCVFNWMTKPMTNGYGQAIVVDDAGNIYATSYKRDYGDGVLLTKYDQAGNRIWARTNAILCCTGDYVSVGGLALDATGNPVVTGGPTGSATIDGLSLYRQGFVAKYRKLDGTPFWTQRLGSMGNAVALDHAGNLYLAGRFSGTATFGASSNLTSSGYNDAFVVKMGVRPPTLGVVSRNIQLVEGASTLLQVAVPGGTGPFGYQWQLNGTNIAGATGSSLSIFSFSLSKAGRYSVVVFNTAASVTNTVADLIYIPVLTYTPVPAGLRLAWPGDFMLQSATNLPGPFLDLEGATSPFTNAIVPGTPEKYFRLRGTGSGATP